MYIIKQDTRGVGRHASPGNFWKSNALRLLLRQFSDRNRAIVAVYTWFAEYCIKFLAVHAAFAKPADIKFPREKVLWLTEQHAGGVTDGETVCRGY